MLTQEEFRKALEKAIEQAGSQTALAEILGMKQSQISDYLRGRFQIENMTIGNLYKLFPETEINLGGKTLKEPIAFNLEAQLLDIYHNLSDEQKVRCLAIVIANFPDKIREETKK